MHAKTFTLTGLSSCNLIFRQQVLNIQTKRKLDLKVPQRCNAMDDFNETAITLNPFNHYITFQAVNIKNIYITFFRNQCSRADLIMQCAGLQLRHRRKHTQGHGAKSKISVSRALSAPRVFASLLKQLRRKFSLGKVKTRKREVLLVTARCC